MKDFYNLPKIAIGGEQASGKTTYAQSLAGENVIPFHLIEPLRRNFLLLGKKEGEDFSREDLVDLARPLRKRAGRQALAQLTCEILKEMDVSEYDKIVVEGVRLPEEIQYLLGQGFELIYMETPEVIRNERVSKRGNDSKDPLAPELVNLKKLATRIVQFKIEMSKEGEAIGLE